MLTQYLEKKMIFQKKTNIKRGQFVLFFFYKFNFRLPDLYIIDHIIYFSIAKYVKKLII